MTVFESFSVFPAMRSRFASFVSVHASTSVLLQCSQAAVFPVFAFRRCSAFGERRCSDWFLATCCAIPCAFPDRHFTLTHVPLWSILEAEGRTVYFGPPSSAKVCALECCCVGFLATLLQAWSTWLVPGTFSVCISADHRYRQVHVQEKSTRCSVAMWCFCLLSWISKCGLQAYGAKV